MQVLNQTLLFNTSSTCSQSIADYIILCHSLTGWISFCVCMCAVDLCICVLIYTCKARTCVSFDDIKYALFYLIYIFVTFVL